MLAPSLLERALESAPDAILIIDAAGRIVFVSRSAERLFGYRSAELLGEPLERLLPESQRARHAELRARFMSAPRTRPMGPGLDLRCRRCDGTEFAAEIGLSPLIDQQPALVIAAIRDVSERKDIEAALEVAREAAERARQSACAARDIAERANRAKSRFLATASHDLRQPLQSLALLNGTLRRTTRDAAAIDALEQQERAIEAMSRLVNALLDIGKFESGAVRPQITEFAVLPLLEQLRPEFTALARQKGLALRFEVQAGILCTDAALLEQVLRNLLSNAVKYTSRGEVTVRCVFETLAARLEVSDTGVGIAPQQLPLIFNEFFQVETADAPRSGYGLGLSIVSRIVNLLELKLEIESTPGVGSRFRLTVPAGVTKPESRSAPPPAQASSEPHRAVVAPRILLIEDEQSVRTATELLLRAAGCEVWTGASHADAFAQLERHAHIDLLISDFHLAGQTNGAEVIAGVRARLGRNVPSILLSGDTSASVQGLAQDEHWRIARKPLRAEELLDLIGELLAL